MKKLKLMLDYQCYPIWIYDEDGKFVDNELTGEIESDSELCNLLKDIMNHYDALFFSNNIEFSYKGFCNENEKKKFIYMLKQAYEMLLERLGDKYDIIDGIDYKLL